MDIKPENFVFVNGTLKMIDLGLALCLPEDEDFLEAELVYGTNLFMAPECFTSRKVLGEDGKPLYLTTLTLQADIWSAGVLLLQMLPIKEARPDPTMPMGFIKNKILLEESLLQETMAVLSLCLEKNPAARPGVAELKKASFDFSSST